MCCRHVSRGVGARSGDRCGAGTPWRAAGTALTTRRTTPRTTAVRQHHRRSLLDIGFLPCSTVTLFPLTTRQPRVSIIHVKTTNRSIIIPAPQHLMTWKVILSSQVKQKINNSVWDSCSNDEFPFHFTSRAREAWNNMDKRMGDPF